MTTADLLDHAIRVIEANGYHRTFLFSTKQAETGVDPAYCRVDILGAINVALRGHPGFPVSDQERSAVRAAELALIRRACTPSLTTWASQPGHGKAEALALLRETAAHLRKAVTT